MIEWSGVGPPSNGNTRPVWRPREATSWQVQWELPPYGLPTINLRRGMGGYPALNTMEDAPLGWNKIHA